ncbi:MAG: hypothetical protein RLZZ136_101 [Pseudomonadota bacterium]|jgi:outer membrane protein
MKKFAITAALAAASALATPAYAGNADGKIQVKVLATGVLADGKIDTVNVGTALAGVASPNTTANDNVVPTLAVEYFVNPNFSIETICCFTQHHVSVTSAGNVAIEHAMDHVLILPATVTLKGHLPLGPLKPYVGAGVTEFFFLGEKAGTGMAAGTQAHLDNTFGAVVQAGVDIAVNDAGMGISLDAKRYFLRPTSHFYNGTGTEILSAKHKLDPWVLSAGVSYRF